MSALPYLRFLHVLSAIIAVGANITYGIIIGRAAKDRTLLAGALDTVSFLDQRLANPAYGVLLITGLLQVFIGSDKIIGTFWLEFGLIGYVLVAAGGALGYTPALRRQTALLNEKGLDSPEYQRAAARGRLIGALLGLGVVLIVFDMVVKPFL
jgi:hypothetical protein